MYCLIRSLLVVCRHLNLNKIKLKLSSLFTIVHISSVQMSPCLVATILATAETTPSQKVLLDSSNANCPHPPSVVFKCPELILNSLLQLRWPLWIGPCLVLRTHSCHSGPIRHMRQLQWLNFFPSFSHAAPPQQLAEEGTSPAPFGQPNLFSSFWVQSKHLLSGDPLDPLGETRLPALQSQRSLCFAHHIPSISCSLMHPKSVEHCLAHSKLSLIICWMNK